LWGGITRIYKHFTILTKTQISHKHLEENQHPIYTIHNTTEILDVVGKVHILPQYKNIKFRQKRSTTTNWKPKILQRKLHLQSFVPTRSINKASSPIRSPQQSASFYVIQKKIHLHISHQQNHIRPFYTHIPYRKNNKNFYTFH